MLSHLAQVQGQRRRIVQDFSEESCPYHESIVSQDVSTFYALLYNNVLILYHQHFFSHCYHFIYQPFIIRPRLIITVVLLNIHNRYARVHNRVSKKYLWGAKLISQAGYSCYYSEKMSLLLPKQLSGMTPRAMTSGEQNSQRAGYNRGGRPIGWLFTGIVQGSILRILICCKGNWSTRLQDNPQLILQFVIMIQLTSRRILRDQNKAPEGIFYIIYQVYILWCQGQCNQSYTSVFKYYFSNT